MTDVCEVWPAGELAVLVLATVGASTAGVLGVVLLCVWLAARPWPPTRGTDTAEP
ncbi:hypothetical protein [Mycolicibacterium mageritense]|uniref:hypothetical protein n=1 Tax=Mycolicibacterium mageritense TaxID=53462 RepID=UPI001E435C35|nr:hypothetical protein [Mycolicibacterium mageritense]GJJ24174.1 hypothetical protein MTY414_78480 [Mycolicibacterium mageritense]